MTASRLFGALLLALAAAATTAEGYARMAPEVSGFFVPTHDVLAVIWPDLLIALQVRVEGALGTFAWTPGLTTVLAVPGWALFGAPGLLLLWRRTAAGAEAKRDGLPRGGTVNDDPFQLFDELAHAAEDEGIHDSDPHMGPSLLQVEDLTPVEEIPGAEDEDKNTPTDATDLAELPPPT